MKDLFCATLHPLQEQHSHACPVGIYLNDGINHAIDRYRIALVGARHIARRVLKLRQGISDLNLAAHINNHMALVEHAVDYRD